jgi:hypothetical protein
MSVHLHRTRQWTGWFLGVVALSPFALCFGSPMPAEPPSDVNGRVTVGGRPASDMTICLDVGGQHAAYGALRADGTFHLDSMIWPDGGALPGCYHAHLYTHKDGPKFPAKYADPATSGIEIEIASGRNDFEIELE